MDSLKLSTRTLSHRVELDDTATAYGSGGVDVLATPALVALMEQVARDTVQNSLPDGHTTVGALVNIRHLAPTAVGREVRVSATVTGIEGRRISFHVEAHDDAGMVGEGIHERVIVDASRFAHIVATRYDAS